MMEVCAEVKFGRTRPAWAGHWVPLFAESVRAPIANSEMRALIRPAREDQAYRPCPSVNSVVVFPGVWTANGAIERDNACVSEDF
jgi:hypothetical protein